MPSRGTLGYLLHPSEEPNGYIFCISDDGLIVDTKNYVISKHSRGNRVSRDNIESMIDRTENKDVGNVTDIEQTSSLNSREID